MRIFSTLLVLLVSNVALFAQDTEHDRMQVQVDVVYLSADLLKGRQTGTEGETMAANYIARRFAEIGVTPKGSDQFVQPFEYNFRTNPHGGEELSGTGKNVVGYIDNGAATTVVIGGHYDHLGMGHFGSRHTGEPAIHNGADDNASGVAAMVLLAEKLLKSEFKNNNYLFIAFSGEEMGLFGSKYFIKNATVPVEQMNYMLNMDMIGRLNDEKVIVINGAGTSPIWKPTFEKITAPGLKVKTSESGIGPSDHTSFYLENVPAIHFFTGQHDDYHKPQDDSELVNYDGILSIVDFQMELIALLDNEGKIAFSKTKDENAGRKAAAFKVSLGVMPDYVYEGKGMRIDGVIEGRPAANAGLIKGDIIVEIGEMDVKDIYDYMEGLAKYQKGDKTTVKVKRGEKEVKVKVVF